MTESFFAHSRAGSTDSWELLEDHLAEVARRASHFANSFDSSAWGYLAGLWHDIGKYRAEFQRRIRGERIQAPHAGAGAARAFAVAPPLAFVIAGHHAGLANRAAQGDSSQTPLEQVVSDNAGVLADIRTVAPDSLLERSCPEIPAWLSRDSGERSLRVELWTRFLFSALVDADRLATEAFYEPTKRDVLTYDSIAILRDRLDVHLDGFQPDTPVNALRADVLASCRRAATQKPGLFSLSVPTGGGKTFASMSFALRHAALHGLRRVIVVAPFTSIIEQNAEVYRGVLHERNVVEHHSAIDQADRESSAPEAEVRRRLAVENWDAPVIVTTAVQFLESLFSNEPSRCRKLHNIARSVIIIDEAQTLPTDFLLSVLDVMRQLASHYGCSLVLSTATQPALAAREALPQGLEGVREIIDDPAKLASSLRRVNVRWPVGDAVTPYEQLAAGMAGHRQALAVVHKRADARRLSGLLPEEGQFHLSTRMCAAHRLETLHAIKERLERRAICRVVSTQLVEAGVDISFPVVYRAMAGLDSLAQAAGRCNRHGELHGSKGELALGEFVIFRAESMPPGGVLRRGLEVTDAMLRIHGELDLTDPATLHEYFRGLYFRSNTDVHGVMPERRAFNFATVARKARLITNATRPVVVSWKDGRARIEEFEQSLKWRPGGSRRAARALQPFVVQVFDHELRLLERQGAIAVLDGLGHALVPQFLHLYDERFGLTLDESLDADVSSLIV